MDNRSPFLSSLQLVLLALFSGNDGRQFSLMNTTLFDQRWLNLHILLQYLCELFFEFGWIWLGDWSLLGLMFSLFGIVVLFLMKHLTTLSLNMEFHMILSPLLLYINDIANSSNFGTFILFADDTNIFIDGKTVKEAQRK